MKRQLAALALAGVFATPAQAGWFDWLDGEWFSGQDGLYVGGAMNVTKLTGQLNRRLSGPNDPIPGSDNPEGFFVSEPGLNTTALLRGGWNVFDFLAIEAQYGTGIDTDRIENQDNSQSLKLDSLYGIYLRPQYEIVTSLSLFGLAGFSDFSYEIDHRTDGRRTFSDDGFAWGGGIKFDLSYQSTMAVEYTQHYDDDENGEVYGIGISVNFLFGQEDTGGGYY